MDLEEPSGWIRIPLGIPNNTSEAAANPGEDSPARASNSTTATPLRAFFLQLAVVANHQNGRDTHVREIKVFGPRTDPTQALLGLPLAITTPEMAAYACVR